MTVLQVFEMEAQRVARAMLPQVVGVGAGITASVPTPEPVVLPGPLCCRSSAAHGCEAFCFVLFAQSPCLLFSLSNHRDFPSLNAPV